jgi:hypothetical protein
LCEARRKPGEYQVRSKTQSPCLHQAVVEIRGIAFCERCAREQEAYFAIGELTRGKHSLRSKPLAKALARMRKERELTGGIIASKSNRSALEDTTELSGSMLLETAVSGRRSPQMHTP